MSKPTPARYRTTNWSSYSAALRKRGSLLIWLDKQMTWLAPHDGSPGRPAVFSDATIQFCLTIKVLFKLPLRQTTGMVASLLRMADLDWPVPDHTTLCRRQKTLVVHIPYRRADGPLNLLVDIEPTSAIDGVDGSLSRHRNVPYWVSSHEPMKGAIHGRDYHDRGRPGEICFPSARC